MAPEVKKTRGRKATPADELVIEAELLEHGMEAPLPGVTYIISLMRYKVLKVVSGSYAKEHILVGHHVPDLSSPQFRVGVRHRLYLTSKFPRHASILNQFSSDPENPGIFFCRSFEVLN